ncbi:MAG: T9SS type A sorting domain-containing protein [Bacteroidia bacterium]|nr:T9SS type A sorting domain-containing protein [Bacteroidia bacterium]
MKRQLQLIPILFLILFSSTKVFSQATVQIIHNSADLSITTVDVWIDNNMLYDDLIFRACSQFLNVTADTVDLVIAASNSSDTTNALFRKSFILVDGESYIIMMNGILSTSGYNPLLPFDLTSFAGARDSAATSGDIDILFFHGVTDESTIDVRDLSSGVFFDDVSFGEYDGYISETNNDITLRLTNAAGTTTINSYLLPAATFGFQDVAVTVVHSGFNDPAMNSNAPFPSGLWMALSVGGGMIELPVVTGIEEELDMLTGFSMYPNPANNSLFLDLSLTDGSDARVDIFDMIGAKILAKKYGQLTRGNNHIEIDTKELRSGIYFCRVTCGTEVITKKLEIRH